jgi:hypothetical protein
MVSKAFIRLEGSSYRMLIFSYLLCRMSDPLIDFQILFGFRKHHKDSRYSHSRGFQKYLSIFIKMKFDLSIRIINDGQ